MAVVGASATCFFLFSSWLCLCSNARLSPPPESNATAADQLALLSFKSLLNSFNGSLDSWNTSSHFCRWPGVACGRRHPERVVALRMPEFNLSGRISPSLGNLSFLRELELRDNLLSGEIPPKLGRLGRLELLNLSTNALVGGIPPAIAECANLVILVLSKNQLHGEIPASLGAMENLYILDLQENHLSGEIPRSLANLPSIEYLFLYSNMLSGEIPPELGNLTGLRHLDLMDNMLSGATPSSLGKMSYLSWLSLGYNSLSGEIPASIWNISNLWGINIQWNNLTGVIPANAFSKLAELRTVSMDNNLFYGPLPASIGNASRLHMLQLGPNSFNGVIPPQIGRLRNMTKLLLSNTLLGAQDPGDWEFMTALANCSQLLILDLTASKFAGSLPPSLSNLSTSLETLYLPYNAISGTLPQEIGNLASLESLVVDSNLFTGNLPSSLGKLRNLQLFSASDNKFHGSIPLSIGNLTELSTFNIKVNAFSDVIPNTLGNLTKLSELRLGTNHFTGQVPVGLFNIHALSIALDLSHNNLEGPIPEEIGGLVNLIELHAESNNFSGQIPKSLGECQLLQNLYLQNNELSGPIPSLLGELRGLQYVDLSSNDLSGQIPGFFDNFTMLYYLNLSYNSFVGEVPIYGTFANASAFYVQGNGKLCGGIPDLHLPHCSYQFPKREHKPLVIPIVVPLIATLIILAFVFKLYQGHKTRKTRCPSTINIQDHPLISYSQLVKATDGFSETNLLGSGSFGSVYKGELEDQEGESTCLVAVKVLKLHAPKALKGFTTECEALRNTRHRNLLKVITVCSSIDTRGDDFKAIVYDFMANGSLEDWLYPKADDQTEQKYLNLVERVTILLDVAHALNYLHCHGPTPIVHCDLKSSNVLLDADMVAHVGDFGLAKILVDRSSPSEQSTSSMGIRGTIGYAAPGPSAGWQCRSQRAMEQRYGNEKQSSATKFET
ncbi:hypothetical protein PR202_ga22149 [Eleusine coracana subsp. coracana]|uniref:non-specific serine/threonine protein kinase n=1 Tax=Eleusine coracana subsp. coracana TaxID=191504 RepID=A0AAV5D2C5_ELECO|nr:hypothetical protein PR202_ga22149 [Eleusine coracana subsp. coracana]